MQRPWFARPRISAMRRPRACLAQRDRVSSLVELGQLRAGHWVVSIGSGGVSLFARSIAAPSPRA